MLIFKRVQNGVRKGGQGGARARFFFKARLLDNWNILSLSHLNSLGEGKIIRINENQHNFRRKEQILTSLGRKPFQNALPRFATIPSVYV